MGNEPLLGAHISIAGGIEKSLLRGHELGCNTIQIFTKSSRGWRDKHFKESEIMAFHEAKKKTGIDPVISHCSYLINLASPDRKLYEKSIDSMFNEMERCESLGIAHLVMHPGSHKESGELPGIEKIAEAINILHRRTAGFKVKILLETTAGQGTNLGYRFEQIASIIEKMEEKSRIGLCLDTCHVFAAGYELRTEDGYRKIFQNIEEIMGMERLMVIHLNDSQHDCGSRIDRHEHIGKGMIGEEPFRWIMNDERFKNIPKIIETPKVESKDRDNLQLLRSFCN
ncbi:MAG: deoxyribonuclease IV [Proteobacteria bacterium]|nr:deoxyribonuclease IV [Pseudomonadota bacterium]